MHSVDHPDIYLVACVVLVTKLLCPFDNDTEIAGGEPDAIVLRMDWEKWLSCHTADKPTIVERHEMDKLDSRETWLMSEGRIDEFLDWYQETRLDERPGESHIYSYDPRPRKRVTV